MHLSFVHANSFTDYFTVSSESSFVKMMTYGRRLLFISSLLVAFHKRQRNDRFVKRNKQRAVHARRQRSSSAAIPQGTMAMDAAEKLRLETGFHQAYISINRCARASL